ncbi:MAG: serine hydrolase [Thermoanaerobaculia bacterium]
MVQRLVLLTLLAVGLSSFAGGQTMARDDLVVAILEAHEGLTEVVDHASDYRLQVALGLVEKAPDGRPVLRQHEFRAGAEYFYPASTVKLFAAVAAAQKLVELREATELAIDLDTPLVYHPQFEDGEMESEDEENIEDGKITVRQQVRKIFLVSDNQAFNYLYELVGQDGLAESMRQAGLESPRIVHRLSEFRTAEENLQSPRIDFVGEDFTYTLPERTAELLPSVEPANRILVGEGYISGDERIDEPMDFAPKNHFPLIDLQRGLCMLVRPDVDCGGPGFELDAADREVMLEAMSQYPRESTNPIYDAEEFPDTYVKDLLVGVERVVPRERLKIYNKTGQAYGFSTENAWVVDTETGQGFFLAATLYTNKDGILNDDEYEYDEIALPFMADLGEAVARKLWQK